MAGKKKAEKKLLRRRQVARRLALERARLLRDVASFRRESQEEEAFLRDTALMLEARGGKLHPGEFIEI